MEQHEKVASRKVLLLRTLGISEATIESLRNGSAELGEVMKARIAESTADNNDFTQCAIVCQNIKMDGASYDTLDPEPYLEHIASLKASGGKFADDPMYISTHSGRHGHDIPSPDVQQDIASGNSPAGSFTMGTDGSTQQDNSPEAGASTDSGTMAGSYQPGMGFDRTVGGASAAFRGAKPVIVSVFPHPFIRSLARFIDLMIYIFIANLLFRFILKTEPVTLAVLTSESAGVVTLWWQALIYVMMFTLEPVMLHLFATTPGKLLFGLKLYGANGSKLTWKEAYRRSFRLFRFGFGFCIPFFSFIRICMSLIACGRKQPLPWDVEIRYTAPKKLRFIAFPVALLLLLAISSLDTLTSSAGEIPSNSLPLTREQFEENCSHIVRYDSIVFSEVPDYVIGYDESGHVKSITYEISCEDDEYIYEKYYGMYVAFMAFVGASPDSGLVALSPTIIDLCFGNCFETYSYEYSGFRITNTVEMTGYSRNIIQNYLYRSADSDIHTYHQIFNITLQ